MPRWGIVLGEPLEVAFADHQVLGSGSAVAGRGGRDAGGAQGSGKEKALLKRALMLAAVGGTMAIGLIPSSVGATSTAGGCALAGLATFGAGGGPGNDQNKKFTYSFTGNLTNCAGASADGKVVPPSGTVEAGVTVNIGGLTYQEPVSNGQGSCVSGTTSGTAVARWSDGTITVISYSTTSAGAAVALTGNTVPSLTVNQVGGTGTATITTTRYSGASAVGTLAFTTADPTLCNTPGGIPTANITGLVVQGNQ